MVRSDKKKKYRGRIPLPKKTEKTHEDKTKYNRRGKDKFDYMEFSEEEHFDGESEEEDYNS